MFGKRKEPHDVITFPSGRKLLVMTNTPHSRKYKKLMKEESKRWREMFDDALIAYGSDNQEQALKNYEKKWGVRL